jgi:uncharacterized repeat protein (TIGR03803 family)
MSDRYTAVLALTPRFFSRMTSAKRIDSDGNAPIAFRRIAAGFVFFAAIVVGLWPQAAHAQYTDTTIYSFCSLSGCTDGANPEGALVADSQGNLYGTTLVGGAYDLGTVYELTPNGSGTWTNTILYSFCPQGPPCADGDSPQTGVIRDANGNLYGTTLTGGSRFNEGTVFELSPPQGGHGPWTETVLYAFCTNDNCVDGNQPLGGLTFDSHGNLYGTTTEGGPHGQGVVFELSPSGGGQWAYSILYGFCAQQGCTDGRTPNLGSLVFDAQGNLYGATTGGGSQNYGTVFQLTLSGGSWTESVLHSFCSAANCTDGVEPVGGVVLDVHDNIYGVTPGGGTLNLGVAYELSQSGGSWTETILQNFCENCTSGYHPQQTMILDANGDLYGNTYQGGTLMKGVAFELSPIGGGQWTEAVLYNFCSVGACLDGEYPYGPMLFDAQGNLYGVTGDGGQYGGATAYELSPHLTPTSTTLTSAPNPSAYGQMVSLAATVHAQDGSLPTGTVIFESNGVQIGSAPLNNQGQAVLTYNALPVGTDNLVSMYGGSSTLAPSTSNTVMQVVNRDLTHTTVASSPNPSTSGEQVTITASITPAGPPTGTVGFTSNGVAISGCTAVTLTSGTAQCVASSLAVGTDALVATYSGDGNYAGSNGSVTQIVNPVPEALQFVTLTPCRVVDTRNADGSFGGPAIQGNTARSFPLAQSGNPCAIPSNAVAYSLNVTVITTTGHLGYLTIWPTGEGQPSVSTMNSPDGRTKANAAIIPAGTSSGSVSVFVTDTTNVLLDIDGYFAPSGSQTLAFYPLTPCRVVDTRNANGPLGGPSLAGGAERDFPVLQSNCSLPSNAAAYSFNFTVLPKGPRVGYLTVWPAGSNQPQVSTLNDPTGTNVANAALVPAGTQGEIATYVTDATDLLIDVDGYFGPAGSGGLSFYALTPCRVIDTRSGGGQPFSGEKTISVQDSPCGPPASSEGYVFNATAIPHGALSFLTLWPDGEPQPTVSTLNAKDGAITSNMAIVPNSNGKTDAWAQGSTQLILDISGYFAP